MENDITLTCNICEHVEHYEDETEMFQGEMWGLPNGLIVCDKCLTEV